MQIYRWFDGSYFFSVRYFSSIFALDSSLKHVNCLLCVELLSWSALLQIKRSLNVESSFNRVLSFAHLFQCDGCWCRMMMMIFFLNYWWCFYLLGRLLVGFVVGWFMRHTTVRRPQEVTSWQRSWLVVQHFHLATERTNIISIILSNLIIPKSLLCFLSLSHFYHSHVDVCLHFFWFFFFFCWTTDAFVAIIYIYTNDHVIYFMKR